MRKQKEMRSIHAENRWLVQILVDGKVVRDYPFERDDLLRHESTINRIKALSDKGYKVSHVSIDRGNIYTIAEEAEHETAKESKN